jgi:peroxiredoxin
MKKSLIASFIVATIAVSTAATVCGDKAALSRLSLLDLEGKSVNPLADSGAKAVVFLFTRADCPISNRYAPEMRRLSGSFASEKVKFWLVYPDADAHPDAIRRHVKEYDYNCEALRDPRRELVRVTGVSVTPEAAVFVFGRSGARMIYRGRIDDRYAAFGKYRPAPVARDLEDVLAAAVRGATMEFKTTPAVGCYISDLNPRRER